MIFVNSMSDLFHEAIPETTSAGLRRHGRGRLAHVPGAHQAPRAPAGSGPTCLASNVWIGVSVENERCVHARRSLRRVAGAVRFIRAEPLLGPLPDLI